MVKWVDASRCATAWWTVPRGMYSTSPTCCIAQGASEDALPFVCTCEDVVQRSSVDKTQHTVVFLMSCAPELLLEGLPSAVLVVEQLMKILSVCAGVCVCAWSACRMK